MQKKHKSIDTGRGSEHYNIVPSSFIGQNYSLNPIINKKDLIKIPRNRSSLRQFQEQLNISANSPAQKRKLYIQSKKLKNFKTVTVQNQRQLGDVRQELMNLRYQLEKKMHEKQIEQKIRDITSKQSSYLNSLKKIGMFPAINNPYSQPVYPIYHPYEHKRHKTIGDTSDEEYEQKRPYLPKKYLNKYRTKNKKKKVHFTPQDKTRLRKIFRKTVLAVTYISHLKSLTKKMTLKRKEVFKKLWDHQFKDFSIMMCLWVFSKTRRFFDKVHLKIDTDLSIEGSQNEKVYEEKKRITKGIIGILINCCSELVNDEKMNEVSKIIHHFCKHGAESSHKALTSEELQTVCISDVHGYLRMDKALEKSQIINFFFFKIILYNVLLQPWKFDKKKFNIESGYLYKNIHFYASVFYQIMNEVQEQYLEETHPESVLIGNWKSLSLRFKIEPSPSLRHLESPYQQGQMISGFLPQQTLVSIFPSDFWQKEKTVIKSIIDIIHKKMCISHKQFINRHVYNYK